MVEVRRASAVLALLGLVAGEPAQATPEQRCAATRLAAAGNVARSMLACQAGATRKGRPPSSACAGRAAAKLARALARAGRQPCYTGGDAGAVGSALAAYGEGVVVRLRPTLDGSACQAAKLKATGKLTQLSLLAFSQHAKDGDDRGLMEQVRKAEDKLGALFAKLEAKNGCLTAGDAPVIRQQSDAFVGRAVLELGGCAPATADQLVTAGLGRWSETLAHAATLGHGEILSARLCPAFTEGETAYVTAVLGTPDDRLYLVSAAPHEIAFLVRLDAGGVVTVFNQNGGVRIPPGGPAEVVAPDGQTVRTTPSATSAAMATGDCAVAWRTFLLCVVTELGPTVLQCGLAAAADLGSAGVLTPLAGMLCLEALAGPVGPPLDVTVCGAPNGAPCDRGSRCSSSDACRWGSCQPSVRENFGVDCTDEYPGLPLCLPGDASHVYTARCLGGRCSVRADACFFAERCRGAQGSAACAPDEPTTTTSSTLPSPCEFQCGDGACIPASIVCNGTPDCTGGDDEDPNVCADQGNCCIATLGCPGETGSSCATTCCCCPFAQACCPNPADGCCASP
jgi:hypothetical protein